jgi:diadenosine tetraphosphate (Ap4A) HIT family hydrolase
MPETPEELHARAKDDLSLPPLDEWESWPFVGALRPKALDPLTPEPEIDGKGGVGCSACAKPDDAYLWADERWRLLAPPEPGGLPVIVLLEPRAHHASMADLPDDLARDLGPLMGRVERAVLSVGGIGKVHIGRWGEGAEHLHWWFIARPEGFGQLRSSFAEIWDGVLPPTPQDVWEANLAIVAATLREQDGGD